ncbi:hypothetical protein LTR15_002845 [Elasticomyces elasticus]|nr:hypothetical protein LTR15_002845 [Elasticomyces elasticus]
MKSLLGSWLPAEPSLTAQINALDLPEILENILLNLRIRDLLFSQAVCRRWKATVDSSVWIQRALFFIPGTAKDARYFSANHISTTAWMKAAKNKGKEVTKIAKYKPAEECIRHMTRAERKGHALNPLLLTYNPARGEYIFRPKLWDISNPDPSKGSWSCMFVTQPPRITFGKVGIETFHESEEDRNRSRMVAYFMGTKQGERFGALMEKYHQLLAKVEETNGKKFRVLEGTEDYEMCGKMILLDTFCDQTASEREEQER